MENKIYTKEERTLVEGAKSLQKLNKALSLDLLLLELEASLGMMDGMPLSIHGIPLENQKKEGGEDGK